MSFHLHEIAVLDQFLDLLPRQPQHVACRVLKLFLLLRIDVRPVALRKAVNENRALTSPENDDRAVAARLPLPWSRYPLLDHARAEVGIHLPRLSSRYGVKQNRV